jgi:rubrerythrin
VVHEDLTPLEAVALAVRSEIESTDLYEKLTERVGNPQVKKLLTDLAQDEEKHRVGLMKLYQEMLGGEEPSVPTADGRKKQWDIDPEADFLTIMTKARDKELDSERFYKDAADKVRDYKTRMFFVELAQVERQHAVLLDKQVRKLQQDPHWFDRPEEESVHEGP